MGTAALGGLVAEPFLARHRDHPGASLPPCLDGRRGGGSSRWSSANSTTAPSWSTSRAKERRSCPPSRGAAVEPPCPGRHLVREAEIDSSAAQPLLSEDDAVSAREPEAGSSAGWRSPRRSSGPPRQRSSWPSSTRGTGSSSASRSVDSRRSDTSSPGRRPIASRSSPSSSGCRARPRRERYARRDRKSARRPKRPKGVRARPAGPWRHRFHRRARPPPPPQQGADARRPAGDLRRSHPPTREMLRNGKATRTLRQRCCCPHVHA